MMHKSVQSLAQTRARAAAIMGCTIMATPGTRTRPVRPELVALVREYIDTRGEREAAQELGLARITAMRVAAGRPAQAGTIALLELALRRRREAA